MSVGGGCGDEDIGGGGKRKRKHDKNSTSPLSPSSLSRHLFACLSKVCMCLVCVHHVCLSSKSHPHFFKTSDSRVSTATAVSEIRACHSDARLAAVELMAAPVVKPC